MNGHLGPTRASTAPNDLCLDQHCSHRTVHGFLPTCAQVKVKCFLQPSPPLCHQLTEQSCWATFSFLCVADTDPAGLMVCVTKQSHHTDVMVYSPHPSHTGNVRHRSKRTPFRRAPHCSAVSWVGIGEPERWCPNLTEDEPMS